MASEIARIGSPTDDLFRRLKFQRTPVVVSGALGNWKALAKWDLEYLAAVLGTTEVTTEVSTTNSFPTLPRNGSRAKQTRSGGQSNKRPSLELPFAEFAARLAQQNLNRTESRDRAQRNGSVENLYLKDKGLVEKFPGLIADIPLQPAISTNEHYPSILWVGAAGTNTPLHYDAVDGLFAQVRGRKQFTLFAPDDSPSLYPFPIFSRISYFSRIDLQQVDRALFPRFSNAKPIKLVLEPGELLYLPAFWWHHVESLEMAISVSYFRPMKGRRRLRWPAVRVLPGVLAHYLDRVTERLRKRENAAI